MGSPATLPVEDAACLFCPTAPWAEIGRGRDYEYDTVPDLFTLRRCTGCGLVFVAPRPGPAAMRVIYPSNYYAYREEEIERPLLKLFRDRIEGSKVRRYRRLVADDTAAVVDVGCGDGRLLDILRRLGPSGWRLAGIEVAEAAARRAAERGFEVRTGDLETLDLARWNGRFGLALVHQVIEHTRDPRDAVRRIARLLRPGGVLSVETPDTRGWDARIFRRGYWGGYHIPRHFYLFDASTLSRLLVEQGFEVVSVRSILSPAFWVYSVHNALADSPRLRRLARWFHAQSPLPMAVAAAIDVVQIATRRQSTNLQLLARKR